MKKRLYAVVFMACIALLLGTGCSGKQPDGMAGLETGDEPPASEGVPAEEGAEEGPYTAVVEIDGYGTVTLELDAAAAPVTTENFVSLARAGFYDGLTFHRIIEGFMVRAATPTATGQAAAGRRSRGNLKKMAWRTTCPTRGARSPWPVPRTTTAPAPSSSLSTRTARSWTAAMRRLGM